MAMQAPPELSADSRTEPTTVPAEVDSSNAKLVYLYLQTTGATSTEDLTAALDIGKLTLFPVLDSLAERDLIQRDGDRVLTCA